MKIPLFGEHAEDARSKDVSYATTINLYEEDSSTSRGGKSLYQTPGTSIFSNVGLGEIRTLHVFNGFLYAISNNGLYQINTAGGAVFKGTINTSGGIVKMEDNGTQLAIVDGVNGYTYTPGTDTFAQITDPNFPNGATHIAFLSGRMIVNDPSNAGRIYISASYDATAWGSLDFATAERDPDDLIGLIVVNRQLWLFGETTTEVWWDTGAPDFPFSPIQNAFAEYGAAAGNSIAAADGRVFWLSQSREGAGLVMQSNGFSPVVISNPAISSQIASFSTISNAIGYTYQQRNHIFYVLIFPSSDVTFVYDMASQKWHQWQTGTSGRHLSNCHAFFNNKHVVGDYLEGKVYTLEDNIYQDDGKVIVRVRRSRHIHADDRAAIHRKLWLDIEEGVGNASVTDPQIMLSWSDDGGHTWSSEYWTSAGKIGEYFYRAIWRNLGRSYDRVYEIKYSDAAKLVLVDGYADLAVSTRTI